MKNSEFSLAYRNNDLLDLPSLLEQQLVTLIEEGNDTHWARTFSEYGIVQLFLANHYSTSIIYKQAFDEYTHDQSDSRKSAAYARFLGLYEAFNGNSVAASSYYRECYLHFDQLDWHEDEAFMILESIYYYSLPYQDRKLLFEGFYRLQKLQTMANLPWINQELTLLDLGLQYLQAPNQDVKQIRSGVHGAWFGSIYFWRTFFQIQALIPNSIQNPNPFLSTNPEVKTPTPLEQLSTYLLELHSCWQSHSPKLLDLVDRLKAKAILFKHPWYRFLIELAAERIHQDDGDRTWGEISQKYKENPLFAQFLENSIINRWEPKPKPISQAASPTILAQGFKMNLFHDRSISLGQRKVDIMDWRSSHLREFFLYLVMHPHGRVAKDVLIENFFPNIAPKKSANRLYVTIHRVNRFLFDHFGMGDSFIQIGQGFVYYNQDLVEEIDVQVFRKLASVANQLWQADQEAAVELMQKATKIYQSHLLSDFVYLDWLNQYREKLELDYGKILRKLAQYYIRISNLEGYEEVYQQLIQLFPYDEKLYQEYISYLLWQNRKIEAHSLYDKLLTLLDQELGLSPSFELKEQSTIRRHL